MTISFATRVELPSEVLVQELAGESVFLNLKSGRYFGLDEVGTHMWKVLTSSESLQTGYETLLAEYDVDAERLRQDVHDLVERLVEHGLVEVHPK